MQLPRSPAALAAVAALALPFAACDVPARSDSWHPKADPEPAPRGEGRVAEVIAAETQQLRELERRADTLSIHLDREVAHLSPMAGPSVWTLRIVEGTIFEPLWRRGAEAGGYEPALARSIEVSDDGRAITVELREGVSFHDGRPLTAADVVFSLDTARLRAAHLRRHLSAVTAVERAGRGRVVLRLRRPSAYPLRALAEVPIVPRHIFEGGLRPAAKDVIGTGPYRLDEWDEEGVRLSRFPGYWGDGPSVRSVAFRHVPDAAEALTLARRGLLDIVPELGAVHAREQLEAPGFSADFDELSLAPPVLELLAVNGHRGALADPRVRRALALAIDREALAAEAREGLWRPASGPVWPGGPVDGPAAPPIAHDPDKAAALLEEAGWSTGDGGIRENGGRRLRLSLLATEDVDPLRERVIEDLRAVGALVTTRVGTPAVLRLRLRDGDFDLALLAWRGAADRDPRPVLAAPWAADDEAMSRALAALSRAFSPAERSAAAEALASAFSESMPVIPLVASAPRGLVSSRLRGVEIVGGWLDLPSLHLADHR